jgi:hypothetical protein
MAGLPDWPPPRLVPSSARRGQAISGWRRAIHQARPGSGHLTGHSPRRGLLQDLSGSRRSSRAREDCHDDRACLAQSWPELSTAIGKSGWVVLSSPGWRPPELALPRILWCRLRRVQDQALAEEAEAGAAVHLPFDRFKSYVESAGVMMFPRCNHGLGRWLERHGGAEGEVAGVRPA